MPKGLSHAHRSPGTRVRLTGIFLRNTGQMAGGEGSSRWTIVQCDCRLCRGNTSGSAFVAVDEPHECQSNPKGYEDIPEAERPRWRHINVANLEVIGAKPKPSDYP
jgi:hypothetical protein